MYPVHVVSCSPSRILSFRRLLAKHYQVIAYDVVEFMLVREILGANAIVVVDCQMANPEDLIQDIIAIRMNHPVVPIVGYVDLAMPGFDVTTRAINAGLTAIWLKGIEETWRHARSIFDCALGRSILHALAPTISQISHPLARNFLQQCFMYNVAPRNVTDIAQKMGTTTRSLGRALRAMELPSAEWIMVNARVLWAVRLLEDSQRRVRDVADLLKITDVKILRRQVAKYVDPNFIRLRTSGTFVSQLSSFQSMLTVSTGVSV